MNPLFSRRGKKVSIFKTALKKQKKYPSIAKQTVNNIS